MNDKINQLINLAQVKMAQSHDQCHDINHVKRVVFLVEEIIKDKNLNLSKEEKQILILAAWWHDVSRAVFKKSSFVWLTLFDDMISALILWKDTIRCHLFGKIAGRAIRIVFFKGIAKGSFLKKIFLDKRSELLLNILKDADAIDILNPERMQQALTLAGNSEAHHVAYRMVTWWLFVSDYFQMKTEAAKRCLKKMLEEFLKWISNSVIILWHIEHFGAEWVSRTRARIEGVIKEITLSMEGPNVSVV